MDLENDVFMLGNAVGFENEKYVASKSFKGEDGEAFEWELRRLSYAEIEEILVGCMVMGEKGLRIDYPKSVNLVMARSVVKPNLNDVRLQERYGVKCGEQLLRVMLTSIEYYALIDKVRWLSSGIIR